MFFTEQRKAYLAWFNVCFFWGTTYLAIKIGVETIPPILFAGIRFSAAGFLMLTVLWFLAYQLPKKTHYKHLIVTSMLLLGATVIVGWAEQFIDSGMTALIVSTLPFWILLIESLLASINKSDRREAITAKKIIGIIIGFSGLIILVWPEINIDHNKNFLWGIVALAFATISWAFGTVYMVYHKLDIKPFMVSAIQMLIGGITFLLLSFLFEDFGSAIYTWRNIGAMTYLSLFGSIIAYGSFLYAVDKIPSSIFSMYAYINPVVAVLLGWVILNEQLNMRIGIAMFTILFGVVIVKKANSETDKHTDTANKVYPRKISWARKRH